MVLWNPCEGHVCGEGTFLRHRLNNPAKLLPQNLTPYKYYLLLFSCPWTLGFKYSNRGI